MTLVKALNEALRIAMRRDPSVFVIGQDVGQYGGVYKVTEGLLKEFGKDRVLDTPISEAAITGASVGAALVGAKPVLEIGFVDFVGTCLDQIFNQAAKYRYLSGGKAEVPLVIRMACGSNGLGYGVHHTQSLEAWFSHVPGLKVVMPSTPADAFGLLLASIEDPDPVVFLEHKNLYWIKGQVASDGKADTLGKGRVVRAGTDLTIVAWSQSVQWALDAADWANEGGISCEVIDLRCLIPLDEQLILDSVRKTGRLIVCHEACETGGFGAEVMARVSTKGFDWLRAAPIRVAAPDIPVAASPPLERVYLQPATRLRDAISHVTNAKTDRRVQLKR